MSALAGTNPDLASWRNHVWGGGHHRQRPSQVKLIKPNPFSACMHDTPNKHLLDEKERSFSHGWIRAIAAATLRE